MFSTCWENPYLLLERNPESRWVRPLEKGKGLNRPAEGLVWSMGDIGSDGVKQIGVGSAIVIDIGPGPCQRALFFDSIPSLAGPRRLPLSGRKVRPGHPRALRKTGCLSASGESSPAEHRQHLGGRKEKSLDEAFTAGVFVALSLIMMLPAGFHFLGKYAPHRQYPLAAFIAIVVLWAKTSTACFRQGACCCSRGLSCRRLRGFFSTWAPCTTWQRPL